jgi:inner membrane protein
VRADGFDAEWSVPHLARNFPQSWVQGREQHNLGELVAGVNLFEPIFLYSKVTRAVKYGLLFIGLTFLTFVIFELGSGTRLHLVQYALIGLALAIFFLTLLALAEHIDFLAAYLVASALVVGMVSLYTATALRSPRRGIMIAVLLTALYTVLYSLLRMEDYALLVGTALLMLALGVLMYVTRTLVSDSRQNHA